MSNFLSKYRDQTQLDGNDLLDKVEGIDEAFQNLYTNIVMFAGSILPNDSYNVIEKAFIQSVSEFNEDVQTLEDLTEALWAGYHPIPHMFSRLRWYGQYGVFHYTDAQVIAQSKALEDEINLAGIFIDSLPSLWTFENDKKPIFGTPNVFEEVRDAAVARLALDSGKQLTFDQVVMLSGMSKRAVQNDVAKGGEDNLNFVGSSISNDDAKRWLEARRNFKPTTFLDERKEPVEMDEGLDGSEIEYEFVPVTEDGAAFTPELKRKDGYQIGPYGQEVYYRDYFEALKVLQDSDSPRFRRPNESGKWGIKNVVSWKRIPRQQLEKRIQQQ